MRVIVAALLLVWLGGKSSAQAQTEPDWPADCRLVPVAELPMTLETGHVVIPASANGKALMLGIDTGGFGSSLTKAGVERLGVGALDVARLGAVIPAQGGLWVSGGSVRLDRFRIGDLEMDRIFLPEMMAFPGVDGLIGPDILNKYDAEFDFAAKAFRLFKPHPCAKRAVTWTGAYTAIDFTLTRDGHVRVPVTLDGRNTDAILDTGAGVSVLSMEDAKSMFGLGPDSQGVAPGTRVAGLSWAKPVNAYGTTFKSLTLGGVTIPGVRTLIVDGRNFLGHDFATLVIGNDVLSHFHLYIAYRQQKLYFTPADAH